MAERFDTIFKIPAFAGIFYIDKMGKQAYSRMTTSV